MPFNGFGNLVILEADFRSSDCPSHVAYFIWPLYRPTIMECLNIVVSLDRGQ